MANSMDTVPYVPDVDEKAFVHESAQVIGNVGIASEVFVGPVAVVRADEPDRQGCVIPIRIASRSNIQDGVILHALGGTGIDIGSGTSIAHGAVVHGPFECGERCFIGFRAVVFKAVFGDDVYVGAGAVVQGVNVAAGSYIEPGSVILSQKEADNLPPSGPEERRFTESVTATNIVLASTYRTRGR